MTETEAIDYVDTGREAAFESIRDWDQSHEGFLIHLDWLTRNQWDEAGQTFDSYGEWPELLDPDETEDEAEYASRDGAWELAREQFQEGFANAVGEAVAAAENAVRELTS